MKLQKVTVRMVVVFEALLQAIVLSQDKSRHNRIIVA